MQNDPRFQGENYWKLPAWYVLKVHAKQVLQYQKRLNEKAMATANLAALVSNMMKKTGSKPTDPKVFLPFDTTRYSPEQLALRKVLSKRTASLLLQYMQENKIPSYMIKLIKASPVYALSKEITNG